MPIKSMTGFGTGCARAGGMRVVAELSSVNRKQLEVALRQPAGYESRVQKIVQDYLTRGRISGSIIVDTPNGMAMVEVDQERARAVVQKLRASAKKLQLEDDLCASTLLEIPEMLKVRSEKHDFEEVFQLVEKALKAALKKLLTMRKREGCALNADLRARLQFLEAMLGQIKELAPGVVVKYREKLFRGLESSGIEILAKDERLLKEIALFGEKSDISEEITRLDSHVAQFKKLLRSTEPAGRALDFLAQEFFREINTIGSKANDFKITEQVMAFKTELERIREQVQNVE